MNEAISVSKFELSSTITKLYLLSKDRIFKNPETALGSDCSTSLPFMSTAATSNFIASFSTGMSMVLALS